MPILNMLGGGGGGVRIPLEPVTNFALVVMNGEVLISWTDPVDKVASPGGELVAEWEYTIIVRKTGSAPTSPTDGVQILKETTRNQYESVTYSDTAVENDTDYYYAAYSVTSYGSVSEGVSGKATPREGVPYYKQTIGSLTGTAYGASTGQYAVFSGQGIIAYGEELAEIVIQNKSSQRNSGVAAARVGNSAIFLGGEDTNKEAYKVDSNLTLTSHASVMKDVYGAGNMFYGGAKNLASVSFGECALFGGGEKGSVVTPVGISINNVVSVTESMTAQIIAEDALSVNMNISAGSSDTHAFFANGYDSDADGQATSSSVQEALVLDKSFTSTVVSTSSKALSMGSMHIGEYCVFGGGSDMFGAESSSDAVPQTGMFCYNSSLTKMDLDDLPTSAVYALGLDFRNNSIFLWNHKGAYGTVEVGDDLYGLCYNEELVRSDISYLENIDADLDKSVRDVKAATLYDNLELGIVPLVSRSYAKLVFETS